MKKIIAFICACVALQGIGAQEVSGAGNRKMLLVYEESNKSIDPWTEMFRVELGKSGVAFLDVPADKARGMDLSSYDVVIIYGSVMAFTSKEPIRDWLGEGKKMDGTKTALFVTANRWYLDKYTGQLLEALKKNGSPPIDVVSAATKNLGVPEKSKLVSDFLSRIRK